ncbi:DNA primase, partial [Streptomyces sp. SID1034]|nr:DNA primase [Streptomyces sp. SID1034]
RPQYEDAAPRPAGAPGPALNLRSPAHRTERELLKLALQHPHLVSPAFDAYGIDEFTAPPYAAVRQCIQDAGGATDAPSDYLPAVMDSAPNDVVRALVTELAVEAIHARTVDEAYAGEQLVAVRRRAVDRRLLDIQGTLARLGQHGDPAQLAAVQNELWVLQQYGQALRNKGAAAL